jgi:hypothetical protein
MNLKDLKALVNIWEIDKEDLVEASLSQQLRREFSHLIGCGDHKNRLGLLLHPGEQVTKCSGASLIACEEGLLKFIDPKHSRGDGFGDADGFLNALFLAGGGLENFRSIEPQEGNAKKASDGLGHHGFSTTLDPEEKQSLGFREAEVSGLFCKGIGPT